MRVGQARKRDANEPEIVQALEAVGVVVRRLSGEGLPDLLCWDGHRWRVVEVKAPGGSLTDAQWQLYQIAPFPIVETIADALSLLGIKA